MKARTTSLAILQETPAWSILDRALIELRDNRDLVEKAAHEYIVSFLCQALAGSISPSAATDPQESRRASLQSIRRAVREANLTRRDLVQELLDERKLEVSHD